VTGPIVIVGCGRSGTTLLYRMLCCHPGLAWFSNITDRWPSLPALAALSNAYPAVASRGFDTSLVPIPSEGYAFWNELTRIDALPRDEPLTEDDVSSKAQMVATDRIGSIMRFQRKRRFVNKATRNVRRLRYVDALLDDTAFIHVMRDPRATVASLLRVAFWPDIPVWCEGGVTPRRWVRMGKDETELAARLWAGDVDRARTDAAAIDSDRLIEVRYEDLTRDPRSVVSEVARWSMLPVSPAFERACDAFRIIDRNRSIESDLTSAQVDTIAEIAGPLAERVGYTW
jgi:hypothetical protein